MERKFPSGADRRGGNGVGAEKGPPGRAADIVFSYYKNSGPEGCPLGRCWRSRDGAIGEQVKVRVMDLVVLPDLK